MTLQPQNDFFIPEETARVARAAFPNGNLYMKMRDALGTIYQDQAFAHLFPQDGRPAEAPWRLALITVIQFLEEMPDRQAADAVRGRIDLKYALSLELSDPGFDFTYFCEIFRRSKHYVVSGCKITAMKMTRCIGESREIFLLLPSLSTLLMIPMPVLAKNAALCGRDTKSISQRHVRRTCLISSPMLRQPLLPRTDEAMTEVIQAELHQADLSPQQHLRDSGDVTSQVLVNSQKRFGIEVIGPAPMDVKWQANAKQGFDISQFVVNWEQHHVVCPEAENESQLDACSR